MVLNRLWLACVYGKFETTPTSSIYFFYLQEHEIEEKEKLIKYGKGKCLCCSTLIVSAGSYGLVLINYKYICKRTLAMVIFA